jgi:imidazolonepropionase
MLTLISNIKSLLQVETKPKPLLKGKDMGMLPNIENAYLLVEDRTIIDFGPMQGLPKYTFDKEIDATGKIVLPTWCDSHTHIVYAGNREQEFVQRIKGQSYEEIAKNGGGILNSAKLVQNISEKKLYRQSEIRIKEIMKLGTGAVEIKSGYGLTSTAELKMLRVIKKLNENYPIAIKATFLAAHAIPEKFKNDKMAFIDEVINKTLPMVAAEKLADYIDVFCETGYFSVDDMRLILNAGKKHGLIPKVHVNQFTAIGGIQEAVNQNALTVDHLSQLTISTGHRL